jgi:hypothetical protein
MTGTIAVLPGADVADEILIGDSGDRGAVWSWSRSIPRPVTRSAGSMGPTSPTWMSRYRPAIARRPIARGGMRYRTSARESSNRIGALIEERSESLAARQTANTGKTLAETRALVASAAGTFRYYAARDLRGGVDPVARGVPGRSTNAHHARLTSPSNTAISGWPLADPQLDWEVLT